MSNHQLPTPPADTTDTAETAPGRKSFRGSLQKGYRTGFDAACKVFGVAFRVVVVAYFLFCALFLGLRYLVLPNIDAYKPRIEALATKAIGNPVTIQDIDASWHGLYPHLVLSEVAVHDGEGRAALRLPRVSATVSWLTLMVGDLRLHSLAIDRPDMTITRDAQGRLYVGGIFLDERKPGDDGRAANWVLSQREIVIRGGRLHWNDALRGAPPLTLEHVDVVLRNHWRNHRFALKATPPADSASPVDIRGNFHHPVFTRRISDIGRWKGELYIDAGNTELAAWKPYVDYPFELTQGAGAVRAWITLNNAKLVDLTADLNLSRVWARLRQDLPPLELDAAAGRISLREVLGAQPEDGKPTFGAHGHAIALTDFSLRTADGLTLPDTTLAHTYLPARDGKPEKLTVAANVLDLQTLHAFVMRLPLPAAQRELLETLAPRGVVRDLSAQWEGRYPELSAYKVRARFENLSLNALAPARELPEGVGEPPPTALAGLPGFVNLSGEINATQQDGALTIASEKLAVQLPAYFAKPVFPFERFNLKAAWRVQNQRELQLDLQRLDFRQDGLSASFAGRHVMPLSRQAGSAPAKALGRIDLTGRINGFEIRKIGDYLPLKTPAALHAWLTGALQGGTADDVRVRVRGDLADFPFQAQGAGKPRGEFLIAGKIRQGVLNYGPGHVARDGVAPAWPLVEAIQGSLLFDKARMEIRADTAKTHGVALANVKAVIPDLGTRDALLQIDGNAAGALADFVSFTNHSPVFDWIAHFTEETRAAGNAKLGLKLQLPLAHLADARVQGSLQFLNNDVTLQEIIPSLSGVNGKLEFHERGFNLNGVRGTFIGGPVNIAGGSQRDGNIVIRADGSATPDGLRAAYPGPTTQRLADRLSGSLRYATSIRVKGGRPDITVESNLAGLGLDFPAPLRKGANEALPLKVELAGLPSSDPAVLRDELRISLGSGISAYYERRKPAAPGGEWEVARGGIGVNVPAPRPDSGVAANVSMQSLDVDAWRRVMTAMTAMAPPTGERSAAADAAHGMKLAQYVEPEIMAARADALIIMGKQLDNVVVGASHLQNVWQANIDSGQASGYVTWNVADTGPGRVTARLASLSIPRSTASDVTELLEGKESSSQMPALDIVAENVELLGKRFGHVEVQADNVRGAAGREWRINKLTVTNPDAQLQATGKWSRQSHGSLSGLSYTLDIHDAGRLLERFGFAHVLRGGKGTIAGNMQWEGMPFALDIPSLTGNIELNLSGGQFLKVEPGAAKLLGVLNMQSIPRRLSLDFRDVFSEGFAFDGVTGTASIANGVARTENFRMRGVTATVLMEGTADIAHETQNLHVAILPEINLGAASVVYGLAVNPVIGLGTFLAQLFLRDPLMRAFTFEYQVTGPWNEPVVTRLARRLPGGDTSGDGRPG